MGNVLNSLGGFLNQFGFHKVHELITGEKFDFDNGAQRMINIFVGGTALVVTLLAVIVCRFR